MKVRSLDFLFPLLILRKLACHRCLKEGDAVLCEGLTIAQGGMIEIDMGIDSLTFSGSHYYLYKQFVRFLAKTDQIQLK